MIGVDALADLIVAARATAHAGLDWIDDPKKSDALHDSIVRLIDLLAQLEAKASDK